MYIGRMETDLRQKVISKLNLEFGSDTNSLYKCHELRNKLMEEKEAIENSLSLASSEVPTKVSAAMKEAEGASREIGELTSEYKSWKKTVSLQLSKSDPVNKELKEYIEKIDYLERCKAYLICVREIENISCDLESSVTEKDDHRSIQLFRSLCELSVQINSSKCSHLLSYLHETINFWHNLLKDKLSVEFDEVLQSLKWPFINTSLLVATPPPEVTQKFQQLTEYLLHLQLPTNMKTHKVTSSVAIDFEPLSLPLSLLLRPLRKRFMFHFYGTRQTNRPDKPEWFFSQILTWIRDHEKFVNQWVQPVYNSNGLSHISAKTELIRGLVQLAVEKLHNELPSLQQDDALFSHLVDEALGFDRELRDSFNYPPKQPGVIRVLTQAQVFVNWINMEKKYAVEKMDAMLSSETAWQPLTTADVDELRITEVGESFLTLLLTITERYSCLPQPGHRLQFLELQLELLDDFRVRLLQLLNEERLEDPLTSRLPTILNTIAYICSVLQEWSQLTHFLQLYFYKSQLQGSNENSIESLEGTVFDEPVELLLRTKTELVTALCYAVIMDIKARSREYRKDRWYAMPSPRELVSPSVTPSACPMFQVLATRLHQLQNLLSVPLFTETWEAIASELNQFIYEEVILMNRFNEGGAIQLQFDMTQNLFPLFAQYTSKPEAHFAIVKEACLLLNLPRASAHQLHSILAKVCEDVDHEDFIGGRSQSLLEAGIQHLTPERALQVLSLRIDVRQLP
ncbi:RAD50-interacting protein 1 [Schistocerca cancellata]|uniref:RAD50-interacting protein 1 n=1 Tax=Schistocerca cancellata TaxID=274614 RepID=UPI0021198AB7|nr:RAD50-interacting protein 1 [Schistocerca cancellata]